MVGDLTVNFASGPRSDETHEALQRAARKAGEGLKSRMYEFKLDLFFFLNVKYESVLIWLMPHFPNGVFSGTCGCDHPV